MEWTYFTFARSAVQIARCSGLPPVGDILLGYEGPEIYLCNVVRLRGPKAV